MKITTSLDIADFVVGKDQMIINEYGPDWSESIERDIADWIDKEERKLTELSDNLLSINIEFEDNNLCLSIDTYDKPLEYIFLNDVEEFKKEIEKLQAERYHKAIKEYQDVGLAKSCAETLNDRSQEELGRQLLLSDDRELFIDVFLDHLPPEEDRFKALKTLVKGYFQRLKNA